MEFQVVIYHHPNILANSHKDSNCQSRICHILHFVFSDESRGKLHFLTSTICSVTERSFVMGLLSRSILLTLWVSLLWTRWPIQSPVWRREAILIADNKLYSTSEGPSLPSRPPFFFTTVDQATLAVLLASRFPFNKKALHIEFILFTQALGSTNDEHQKVVIPEITVFISVNLLENYTIFVDQEEKRVLIWWSNGSQLAKDISSSS